RAAGLRPQTSGVGEPDPDPGPEPEARSLKPEASRGAEGAFVLAGGCVVTMDAARRVLPRGDVVVVGDRIVAVGDGVPPPAGASVIDCTGCIVLPGLIQAHVHLCQTLLRGRADDAPLLEWLRDFVWPYEAALDARALRASARLGCAELLR